MVLSKPSFAKNVYLILPLQAPDDRMDVAPPARRIRKKSSGPLSTVGVWIWGVAMQSYVA